MVWFHALMSLSRQKEFILPGWVNPIKDKNPFQVGQQNPESANLSGWEPGVEVVAFGVYESRLIVLGDDGGIGFGVAAFGAHESQRLITW